MKVLPSTTSRSRINTVYPPPNKRTASSYGGVQQASYHRVPAVNANQAQLSPRSASFLARKREAAAPVARPPMPYRTSSAMYTARRTPPPQSRQQQQYDSAPSEASLLIHKRAVLAQRQALYARKQEFRWGHVNSLDRGIRLLLEEEYREDVKACLLEKEKHTLANAPAMDQQPELQWYMRSHLIEFLLEIHLHFRLRPETLFLTMSILDRYVSRRIVYKKHYQLVGCVALWLAAKFEDAKERVPSVKDLNELCHGQYDDGSFSQMEHHVLTTIDWDLGHPTPESWLRVLCTETHLTAGLQPLSTGFGMYGGHGALGMIDSPFEDMRTQHVARFLMELTLFGRDFIQFVPSVIALGSLCLAREICGKSRRIADESTEVLRVISLLDTTLAQALDSVSQVLVKKYSYSYYSKASGIVVSFYLRGNRYPIQTAMPVDSPEVLATYTTPVEQLRAPQQAAPVTPVRQRAETKWGSGSTDVQETPGLTRSDSCSSGMDVDLDAEIEDEEAEVEDEIEPELTKDGARSVRSFSQPREFDEMDDDEDEEEEDRSQAGEGVAYDEEEFDMERATVNPQQPMSYFQPAHHHHYHHQQAPSTSHVSDLGVPSSDDLGPITPTTPMFQLDPFGTAQAQQPPQVIVHHVVSSKDKENVGPDGYRYHHHHQPQLHHCDSALSASSADNHVRVEDGQDDMVGASGPEFRHALLAIS